MEIKKHFFVVSILLALVIGFGAGTYSTKNNIVASGSVSLFNQEVGKPSDVDFSTFWQVWKILQDDYVDGKSLDTQKLVYGAINGLVDAVGDPYTVFFEPKESEEFQQQISGSFSGIGIEIGLRDEEITVVAPIKDTPASKAGLRAGDKIRAIDGTTTRGMGIDTAVSIIRGKKGTQVVLTINRSDKNIEIPIIRDTIKIPAVVWEMKEGDIAYLQVFVFNQNVDSEFKKAAQEIAGSQAKKIILDLRNNPGGLLDSSINLANYFLDPGTVVTTQRDGNGTETIYKTERNGILKNFPVVILANGGSASASEILAGALHDNRNIQIIGETTFGKGSVQDVRTLPQKASLKITFAKWFTPNGLSISDSGIKPNIEIVNSDDDILNERDPQLDKALEIVRAL